MITSRRGLLITGGSLLVCAPSIVRATSLDLVRGVPMDPYVLAFQPVPAHDPVKEWYPTKRYANLPKWRWKEFLDLSRDKHASPYRLRRQSETLPNGFATEMLGEQYCTTLPIRTLVCIV